MLNPKISEVPQQQIFGIGSIVWITIIIVLATAAVFFFLEDEKMKWTSLAFGVGLQGQLMGCFTTITLNSDSFKIKSPFGFNENHEVFLLSDIERIALYSFSFSLGSQKIRVFFKDKSEKAITVIIIKRELRQLQEALEARGIEVAAF
jgi:hypothetical protein